MQEALGGSAGAIPQASVARRRADAWHSSWPPVFPVHTIPPASARQHLSTQQHAGLPEHVSHTKQALALGYSVLAMDPTDSRHQCWSSSNSKRGFINDQPHVRSRTNGLQLLCDRLQLPCPA